MLEVIGGIAAMVGMLGLWFVSSVLARMITEGIAWMLNTEAPETVKAWLTWVIVAAVMFVLILILET